MQTLETKSCHKSNNGFCLVSSVCWPIDGGHAGSYLVQRYVGLLMGAGNFNSSGPKQIKSSSAA